MFRLELNGKTLTNHVQGCEFNIHWKKKKAKPATFEPQDEKGLLVFGILLKSLEKQISSHPRKQADLNTYLYNSQNKGTTPRQPGWGWKPMPSLRRGSRTLPPKRQLLPQTPQGRHGQSTGRKRSTSWFSSGPTPMYQVNVLAQWK